MDPNSTGCVPFHSLSRRLLYSGLTYLECSNNLHRIAETCKLLGVPLAPEKLVGPTRQLTFLGIEIDSESLQLRLPQDKLEKLKLLITSWHNRKAAKKRQLLSLIGHLVHACKVVPHGLEERSSGASSICHVFQKTWTTGFA